MSLDDKVAVVTGATKGIGRGVGRELARCGARVFITGRSAPEYERLDDQVVAIRCDHRVDADVDAAFQRIVREAS
jgi:NAD(P)-dependent dehydrogenase (short-subunit alcohol dehydrogenase family)